MKKVFTTAAALVLSVGVLFAATPYTTPFPNIDVKTNATINNLIATTATVQTGTFTTINAGTVNYTNPPSPPSILTASLPAAGTGAVAWSPDVLTPFGSGGLVYYDGATWRVYGSQIAATTDPNTYFLNSIAVCLNLPTPLTTAIYQPENCGQIGNLPRIVVLAGTGAQAALGGSSIYGTYVAYQTGTTSTGTVTTRSALLPALSAGVSYGWGGAYSFSAVCDGTETYWSWLGLDSVQTATLPVSGCFFLYDRFNVNAHNKSYTNNWICVTAASSSYSYADSGLPVSTLSTFQRLAIRATTTACYFFTNGVLAATITNNIPTTTLYTGRTATVKTAGSTTRFLAEASPFIHNRFSTPRVLP